MFDKFEGYKQILVTGPQRSGTRIAAKMIAHTLGHEYVDEGRIHADSIYTLYHDILQTDRRVVVQCPALCYAVPQLVSRFDGVCGVFMLRKLTDIAKSEKRVGWDYGWLEKIHYGNTWGPIADIKERAWFTGFLKSNLFSLEYESLRFHPLWVPEGKRAGFHALQTSVDDVPPYNEPK